ncbi:MAG: cell filamentation protein Fic [Clostridia bacterium]|nr:cell filamentation protein Fic [Clostridia bacterium]
MKISIDTMQKLSKIKNSVYDDIKIEYLYHSNKLEGSTFSIQQLNILLEQNMVTGEHSVNDVQETINSLELFDFVIDTLNEKLTPRLLREYHSILKKNTSDENYGFVGVYKKIPNKLRGVNIELAKPYEVEELVEKLLEKEIKELYDIANFHQQFEKIHPFQDGNGRIGRFIMLKQCIENSIDLIAIDDEYNKEYRESLYKAQTTNEINSLVEVLKKCQVRLEEKLSEYISTIKQVSEEVD